MSTVSQAAMISRIRRALASNDERLCIPRNERELQELGIHIVDNRNLLVASYCSVADLASRLALLKPGEKVEVGQ